MADMIVAGAGTTAVNGTYVENGTYQYHPRYTKSDGKQILWMSTRYMLGDANMYMDPDYGPQGTRYYDSYSAGDTPDTVTTWLVALHGSPPVPTVTAASSGTTHEGEATLSSLSYLRTKKS